MFAGTGVLFVSLFMMMVGNGLQSSLLGIRGSDEGFSMMNLSLIASGFYIGYFLGSIFVAKLIQRVGYIRVFAVLVAFASVAAVVYAMAVTTPVWLLMRILTGFCFAGIYMIVESWLNSQTNNDNRAKVLGVYVIILFFGLSVGQLLLNVGDIGGYYLFALASIIISLASVPLLLTSRPVPEIESVGHFSVLKLYKRSPMGTVSTFFANFINGAIVGMSAIYAKDKAMATDDIALFVASAFIGVIILQYPLGYLSDHISRRKVIIGLSLASIIVVLLSLTVSNPMGLIVLFGLLGGLTLPLHAICIAYVNDRLRSEEILPATSALLKISGTGNMISPLLVGYIMVNYGTEWFYGSIGVAAVIIILFGLYRMTKRDDIDVDDMSEFAPMGVSTTAATMSLINDNAQLEFDFGEEHRTLVGTKENENNK